MIISFCFDEIYIAPNLVTASAPAILAFSATISRVFIVKGVPLSTSLSKWARAVPQLPPPATAARKIFFSDIVFPFSVPAVTILIVELVYMGVHYYGYMGFVAIPRHYLVCPFVNSQADFAGCVKIGVCAEYFQNVSRLAWVNHKKPEHHSCCFSCLAEAGPLAWQSCCPP